MFRYFFSIPKSIGKKRKFAAEIHVWDAEIVSEFILACNDVESGSHGSYNSFFVERAA